MAAPGAVLPGLAGDLAHLREHWGIAYIIACAGERWTAERRDDHQVLARPSAG